MRIVITLSYDGTNFCGWQIQPNKRTVQQTVEDAIFTLTKQKVKLFGSGRTDAGVHAEAQVAHFDIENCTIPPEKFYRALDVILPEDVKAMASALAKDGFDATRSAKRKTYVYRVYESDVEIPLKERFSLRVNKGLNLEKMQAAASLISGKHDFKCFSSTGGGAKTSIRTVYALTVEKNGADLIFSVTGDGFLYNMVRIIVGTLIKVGYGKADENDIEKMLSGGGRELGGDTLPAKGLCLKSAEYLKA